MLHIVHKPSSARHKYTFSAASSATCSLCKYFALNIINFHNTSKLAPLCCVIHSICSSTKAASFDLQPPPDNLFPFFPVIDVPFSAIASFNFLHSWMTFTSWLNFLAEAWLPCSSAKSTAVSYGIHGI